MWSLDVVAEDISNKPNEIPQSQWLVKGRGYTAVALCKSMITGDMYFKLEEVQPPPPYMGYKIERFEILGELEDIMKELNDAEIEEII